MQVRNSEMRLKIYEIGFICHYPAHRFLNRSGVVVIFKGGASAFEAD